MLATDAKNAENETRYEFFVRKPDWHNLRSYLFFNLKISDKISGLSVQGLKSRRKFAWFNFQFEAIIVLFKY